MLKQREEEETPPVTLERNPSSVSCTFIPRVCDFSVGFSIIIWNSNVYVKGTISNYKYVRCVNLVNIEFDPFL